MSDSLKDMFRNGRHKQVNLISISDQIISHSFEIETTNAINHIIPLNFITEPAVNLHLNSNSNANNQYEIEISPELRNKID